MNQPWNNQQNTITPNNIFGKPQTNESSNFNNSIAQQTPPSIFGSSQTNSHNISKHTDTPINDRYTFGSASSAPLGSSFIGNTNTTIPSWDKSINQNSFGYQQPNSISPFGNTNQNNTNTDSTFNSTRFNTSTVQTNPTFSQYGTSNTMQTPNSSFMTSNIQNTRPSYSLNNTFSHETQSNYGVTSTMKYKEMPLNMQERLKSLYTKIKTPSLNIQKFVLPEIERKESITVGESSRYLKKEFHKLVETEGVEVSEFMRNLHKEINIYNKEVNGEEYITNLITTVNELIKRINEE